VAHETEIPTFGDYVTATVAGRPIVVTRGDNDKITAFYNTCTHRGALIANGAKGNCGGAFTCLYHAWCFDTDGKLTSVPRAEAYGDELKKACYDIPQIRVEQFAGNIFINFDAAAEPLIDYLGDSAPWIEACTGNWEALGRVRWTLEGNWKLWHENFRDNYHPMYAHHVLTLNYQGVKIEGENIDLQKGHSVMPFPPQGNPQHYSNAVRRLTGRPFETAQRFGGRVAAEDRNLIMAIFPNLDFQHGNGANSHTMLQVVRPLGIDRAVIEMVVFGIKGESAEARQARLDAAMDGQSSAGKISGDDMEAARRCSVGFGAVDAVRWSNMGRGQKPGLTGGKNDEYSLRSFYAEYKKYLHNHIAAIV
jgi:benzoate/toluate 1,2-dioxygenase alpha subunit